MASFALDYRPEGEPLQVVAELLPSDSRTRKATRRRSLHPRNQTLLLTAGMGFVSYGYSSSSAAVSVYIRHIWGVEWLNHGKIWCP
ncbi:hypothetical protein L208DRAFT_160264 [Tricholoma matsutake]|nr:hypothetical protein L208DRAFT_160264 [Tricholoma matsutake 945]